MNCRNEQYTKCGTNTRDMINRKRFKPYPYDSHDENSEPDKPPTKKQSKNVVNHCDAPVVEPAEPLIETQSKNVVNHCDAPVVEPDEPPTKKQSKKVVNHCNAPVVEPDKPLMIGDLIPIFDEVWNFNLVFIKIIDILLSYRYLPILKVQYHI